MSGIFMDWLCYGPKERHCGCLDVLLQSAPLLSDNDWLNATSRLCEILFICGWQACGV